MDNVHTALEQIGTYLDHDHYIISAKRAGMLCKDIGGVPRHGYEKRATYKGFAVWVTRTPHHGKQVWAVYPA